MSIVKSFAVGNGDMFYIKHNSDNFSLIDCCLSDENREDILSEILLQGQDKQIRRFISTHPDEDHIVGLEYLDAVQSIINFYCINNAVTKDDVTPSFEKYCELRDSSKAFNIFRGCTRRWMNQDNEERGSSGLHVLWPNIDNENFQVELAIAEDGGSPNNTSIILQYKLNGGATILWFGDLEYDFMSSIRDEITLPKSNIIFAAHHGRRSGRIPKKWLEQIDPDIIILGEAPVDYLDYAGYSNYNTITQNSAGDITFDCETGKVHIYVSNEAYTVDFLTDDNQTAINYYLGTLLV